MNLKELYQEIILEHGKNPRNLGKTEDFILTGVFCGNNLHYISE